MSGTDTGLEALLGTVAQRARDAGVFGEVTLAAGRLDCEADGSAEPASYQVYAEGEKIWVALVMADRWQSESIESDLMHTGDKLEELLEEEMVDLGYEGPTLPYEHFRSDEMLFTFRTPLPASAGDGLIAQTLLGYEACFRQLGDMDDTGDEGE